MSEWIPVTYKKFSDVMYEFTCPLPSNHQSILITTVDGLVISDVFFDDGELMTTKFGNDWTKNIVAWMPYPKPYERKADEEKINCNCKCSTF